MRTEQPSTVLELAVARMNSLGASGTPFLFIFDYELKQPMVMPLSDLSRHDIEVEIEGHRYSAESICPLPRSIELDVEPIPYSRYRQAFDRIHRRFVSGETYLANLTFATPIQTNLSFRQWFALGEARYKLRYAERFVCCSPESFVTIEGRTISSFPMKGTINADIPDARERLLADEKETAEHTTIVDLIRNDIGRIATRVEVPRFRYLELIETPFRKLLQMSSEIRGRLDSDWPRRIGSIIGNLLPAGSICGAPKVRTVEVIATAEHGPRGYYTGVFGIFDGRRLSSGVMIRFAERTEEGSIQYRSGGGLTIYADPAREYQELLDKIYVPALRDYPLRKRSTQTPRSPRSPGETISGRALRD